MQRSVYGQACKTSLDMPKGNQDRQYNGQKKKNKERSTKQSTEASVIQSIGRRPSSLSLVEIPQEHKTDLSFYRISTSKTILLGILSVSCHGRKTGG